MHHLQAKDYLKAIGVGIASSLVLSAIMVTGIKTGVSPMPAPVALAFAEHLLGRELPLPVGILFHVAWVTFWSVAYVVLFRDRLSFRRAAVLAAVLLVFALAVFFPFIGWGFIGLAVGPKVIIGAFVTHALFAALLWSLCHWAFGTTHEAPGQHPVALRRG
ncbi:MAG TPA: hypothetical protein VE935_07930 [Burkholderiales bacterium]|nr:hypothetical protein [Burkholderiales bacterium]